MLWKTSNIWLVVALFGVLVSPVSVQADGPVIRSSESVSVESNQVLEGDFYALGQDITVSGAAERDVYVLGGTITVNAPVSEDLTAVGAMVQVHGAVADDVRIIGGEVIIAEPVADDLVVIAQSVRVLSTASVGGDLIFFGGQVSIDGPVEGTVYGRSANLRIDARVGGDVSVQTGQSITLGDKADIAGNVSYVSPFELTRAQNAVVLGTITKGASAPVQSESVTPGGLVLTLLVLVFSGLTVFFIFRGRVSNLIATMYEGYGRLGLIGLGMILALPLVAAILMTSLIGLIIGGALMLGYFLLLLVSLALLPIVLGMLVQRVLRLGETLTVFTILLGVFVVIGLSFIPVIGIVLISLCLFIEFGALSTEFYRFAKSRE